MAATYWGASNVTAELTDPTAVGFSNWWTDETSNINNLNEVGNGAADLVDSYWDKVNLATSNTTYWTEFAHANSWTNFDHEYCTDLRLLLSPPWRCGDAHLQFGSVPSQTGP